MTSDPDQSVAEQQIREIIDYCAELYYPQHEYGDSHADQNKEYLDEAVNKLKALLLDAQKDVLEEALWYANPDGVIETVRVAHILSNVKRGVYVPNRPLASLQQTRQEEVRE